MIGEVSALLNKDRLPLSYLQPDEQALIFQCIVRGLSDQRVGLDVLEAGEWCEVEFDIMRHVGIDSLLAGIYRIPAF